MKAEIEFMQTPTPCNPIVTNCSECCNIFVETDPARRDAFGYDDTVTCDCHDICVEDVRDICAKTRTITQVVPCNPNGMTGCRGGFLPDGVPTVVNTRVSCAEERLSTETGCDRINNKVGFEVVLRFDNSSTCLAVITPTDTFSCFFFNFAEFPSGTFFPNTPEGLAAFREELAVIDGSCKVIIIESSTVTEEDGICTLTIIYRAIDKLWKHENLLVSALKPYLNNITVDDVFQQGQQIGPCPTT